MPPFQLKSDFQPTGDQPAAIAQLMAGLQRGDKHQVLLGATGTGKTVAFECARVYLAAGVFSGF